MSGPQRVAGWIPRPPSRSSATETSSPSSIIYNCLPAAVQSRIPQFPSLRRFHSACNVRVRQQSSALVGPSWTGEVDAGFIEDDSASTSSDSRVPSSYSSPPPTPPRSARAREWMYANHGTLTMHAFERSFIIANISKGINLLENVLAEVECPDQRNQIIARQQYIHSLAFLMHGLPQDLSKHEITTIENALPAVLQGQLEDHVHPAGGGQDTRRSIPRRALASAILRFFLLLQLFLPYLRLFIKAAYEFERTHHVGERAIATSASALNSISNAGVEIYKAISKNGNGRAVQVAAALTMWWIKEVSSGVHEGVESCVNIIDNGKGKDLAAKTKTT